MLAFDVALWSLAGKALKARCVRIVGSQGSRKNSNSHIDASHSRQPLVKGERLVRYEVNAVMRRLGAAGDSGSRGDASNRFLVVSTWCIAHSPRTTGRSRRPRDFPEVKLSFERLWRESLRNLRRAKLGGLYGNSQDQNKNRCMDFW